MNTNEQFGYDKLLTKEEFYLDVIYPNIVKSAGIFYFKEEYARAKRNGNTIEDVIQQTFFYAYKPLVRGGKYGKAGGTIYDYYVENYFHVKNGDVTQVPIYEKDENGKKVETGEYREVPITPCLNTIRAYMNTFVRNVLVDMCKVAENQKTLVSFDTPIGDEEDGRTLLDVFSDTEDSSINETIDDFHISVKDTFLINTYGKKINILDVLYSLESGSSVKDVCNQFNLSTYDVLNFFKENFNLMQDSFDAVTDVSRVKLEQKLRRAKKELSKVEEVISDYTLDAIREFMLS